MAHRNLISISYSTEKRNYEVTTPAICVGRGSSPRPILGPASPGFSIFYLFPVVGGGGLFPLVLNPVDLRIEIPIDYGRLGREGY